MENTDKVRAYKEIAEVLKKHSEFVRGTALDVIDVADALIKCAELFELFGLNMHTTYNRSLSARDGYLTLSGQGAHAIEKLMLMGEKHRRTIGWSDDGRQPEDEWLYIIGFSTGAYFFGEHYPATLFSKFWKELVGLKPKYIDTANHCLYFSHDNAAHAQTELRTILKKYSGMVKEDKRRMDIEKLESELTKLKGE